MSSDSCSSESTSNITSNSNSKSSHRGHCYCEKVKFTVRSDLGPTKPVYCHCESCRRAHASPLYQVVYVPPAAMEIEEGEDLVKAYSRSPESVHRYFCSHCGSKIMNKLPLKPELGVGFFPALLEEADQHALPEAFRPIYHYLSNEAVLDLSCLHDGLDRK